MSASVAALLAMVLGWIPTQGASVVPPGRTWLGVGGGFAAADLAVAGVVLPVPTGELELAHGLAPGVDLRGRYATILGLIHRAGPELRAALSPDGETWWLGARAWTTVEVVASEREDQTWVDGGELATQAMAMLTWRGEGLALSLELGATVHWLLWDESGVDDAPYLAFADAALGVEWPTSRDSSLWAKLEIAIPASPEPFTIFGTYPRAIFGGSLPL